MKRRSLVVAAVFALSCLIGCSKEPRTELVRKLEAAGAGDVRTASTEGIEQWFKKHNKVAQEVDRTCQKLREKAPSNWAESTDGRICSAAARVTFFNYMGRKPDGTTFSLHDGKK